MFHVITAVICLYVVWRVVLPLPLGRRWKWLAGLSLLAVSQHHLVSKYAFGGMTSPEIPGHWLLLFGWLFGGLILLALLLLLRDAALLPLWPWRRRLGRPAVGLGLALAATLLSAVGVWQAVKVPEVRRVEIVLPRLPAALDGLRIVQLTDLHASRLLEAPWMAAVVARANALQPDLMLLTGDLVDGKVAARAADVAPLRDLAAPLGVFAIPGNHEYYVDYVGWMPALRALGLRMLLNAHAVVGEGERTLVLAGITDVASRGVDQPLPDLDAALAGVPAGAPVILLAHRPVGAALHAGRGVDLQLSGHTHGGQILGGHVLAAWANEGFVSGVYRVGGMGLYVSNGAGLWNGFPIRLGRPSEITEITLRRGGLFP